MAIPGHPMPASRLTPILPIRPTMEVLPIIILYLLIMAVPITIPTIIITTTTEIHISLVVGHVLEQADVQIVMVQNWWQTPTQGRTNGVKYVIGKAYVQPVTEQERARSGIKRLNIKQEDRMIAIKRRLSILQLLQLNTQELPPPAQPAPSWCGAYEPSSLS